jgi:CheY-like chemotaxis protein
MARVLFVDDDPDTLITLKRAIELFGHSASLASSGAEALQAVRAAAPDLIFVDMNLPDMSGLTLVEQLKSELALAGPIYMLSAGPEIDLIEKAKAAGAAAFLSKPIRLQQLLEVVNGISAS